MVREFDERNMARSRERCAAMAERAGMGRRALPERERRILDMWPRYEDGEPVMIGDGVDGLDGEIIEVYIAENAAAIWNNFANHMHLSPGERVKRPAPEVLDADGVSIKVDDTVWHEDGSELHVIGFGGAQDGETMLVVEYAAGPTKWGEVRCLSVTHTRPAPKVLDADGVEIHVGDTVYGVGRSQHSFDVIDPHHIDPEVGEAFSVRCYDRDEGEECHCRPGLLTHDLPDSWKQLESDANKDVVDYWGCAGRSCYACPAMIDGQTPNGRYGCRSCKIAERLDIIRRAKALAGVEVDA